MNNQVISNLLKTRFKNLKISPIFILKTVYRPYYGPIKELIDIFEHSRNCLEIGCGFGPVVFSLHDAGLSDAIEGLDNNRSSIKIANSAVRCGEKIKFSFSDNLEEIDFKGFDSIILFDVLHHLNRSQQQFLLSKVFEDSLLSTKIYIKDLSPKPFIKAFFNRVTDFISTKSKVNYISIDLINNIAQLYGYEIVYQKINFYSLWSHYLIKLQKIHDIN